ncbi:MAG: hypothetical protein PHD02_00560 [Bacilli bacterium]|nr:hypothetical protein [Bacilli bacterium]
MKKLLIMVACLLLITGCGSNTNKLEEELTIIGNDYYSKYMIGNNLDIAVISLKDFREVNENMGEDYDLSLFKNCDESTNIKIYLKSGTTQIEKYEFELNCEN